MRVGQPRHMPRAEKRVIECFASTTDAQILQSILGLVHTAGKTERSELSVYVRLTCAPNNFTVVYGNISRMRKQCTGPSGRGLGTRLSTPAQARGNYYWASGNEPTERHIY